MSIFIKDICNFLVVSLPGFGISVKVFKIHSGFKKKKRERETAWLIVFTKVLWLCTHLMGTCKSMNTSWEYALENSLEDIAFAQLPYFAETELRFSGWNDLHSQKSVTVSQD